MAPEARCSRCLGRLAGKVRRACRRWSLLPAEGRVALAISGGWDSLAMTRLLVEVGRVRERPLALVGLHLRLDADGVGAALPETTRSWCAGQGVDVVEVVPRFDPTDEPPFDCFRCARIRRRALLEAAAELECSHLALGHHADDVVETWLLGLFYSGRGGVLAPVRSYFDGAVVVARPLYELRHPEIHRLGRLCGFPRPLCACPRTGEARRNRIREVLKALGRDERIVRRQLFWAAVRQWQEGAGATAGPGGPEAES